MTTGSLKKKLFGTIGDIDNAREKLKPNIVKIFCEEVVKIYIEKNLGKVQNQLLHGKLTKIDKALFDDITNALEKNSNLKKKELEKMKISDDEEQFKEKFLDSNLYIYEIKKID